MDREWTGEGHGIDGVYRTDGDERNEGGEPPPAAQSKEPYRKEEIFRNRAKENKCCLSHRRLPRSA